MVSKKWVSLVGVVAAGALLWCSTAPREELEVGDPVQLGAMPRGLARLAKPEDWLHAHPWIKPLLLRLPLAWIPKGGATGVLAFDPRLEKALFLALHDGSLIRDVSVAIPSRDRIYLASFDPSQRGLSWIPRPSALQERCVSWGRSGLPMWRNGPVLRRKIT
jgi:hypothetical protein